MPSGILFLVVGPSGAGKDTLIAEARRRLDGDPGFVFPRRTITRPADAGGEDHRALDEAAFVREESASGFALSWRAHGLAYGISADIRVELATGRHVIANVSRSVVTQAAAQFPHTCVIHVTASPEQRRARLAARQREGAADQEARISRSASLSADTVIEIVNDDTIAAGGLRLLGALQATANGAR